MPVQFPQFQRISFDEANPALVGAQRGQQMVTNQADLISKYLENQVGKIKAQYAPLTVPAEAYSKLAYANLMGPQFISKLMANPQILANIPEEQRNQLLPALIGSGMRPGMRPGMQNTMFNPQIKNVMENGENTPQSLGRSFEEQQRISQMQPGESYVVPQNVPQSSRPQELNQYGEKTWPEKVGEFQGTEEELKESGKYRAGDIHDLGKEYEGGLKLGDKFNVLSGILTNPEWINMRKEIPFFQGKQLDYLSKMGTPVQQELIGQYRTTAQEIIRDTVSTFSGQILKGELNVANDMKVNDNDTVNAAIGKVEAAMLYKNLNMKRAEIAADIMENQHISKRKALQQADKQIDGDKIRKQIETILDYPVDIRRQKPDGTYERKTIKRSEARKLGVSGV